jgi:hypothetical protein
LLWTGTVCDCGTMVEPAKDAAIISAVFSIAIVGLVVIIILFLIVKKKKHGKCVRQTRAMEQPNEEVNNARYITLTGFGNCGATSKNAENKGFDKNDLKGGDQN